MHEEDRYKSNLEMLLHYIYIDIETLTLKYWHKVLSKTINGYDIEVKVNELNSALWASKRNNCFLYENNVQEAYIGGNITTSRHHRKKLTQDNISVDKTFI